MYTFFWATLYMRFSKSVKAVHLIPLLVNTVFQLYRHTMKVKFLKDNWTFPYSHIVYPQPNFVKMSIITQMWRIVKTVDSNNREGKL